MKYVDVPSLFEGDRSHIAFLATYQFDPDFFERRLLRSSTLQKARRIVVFVDRSEWLALLRRDIPARYVNRRYLVVPVRRSSGSFHAKLSLLLSEAGGRILCGSNNLTRAGCSSNLELLNAVCFEFDKNDNEGIDLAREAFGFFEQAARHTDDDIARIVDQWLQETVSVFPWLRQPVDEDSRTIRLLHSYAEPLWRQMTRLFAAHDPEDVFIISPFHDLDAELFHRFSRSWPDARIEVLVQQDYTTLPIGAMKGLRHVRLSEILDTSRRLHAKLVAWRHRTGAGCLTGSANFTCAAFDGANVEACLFLASAGGMVDALFDKDLKKVPIALKDFEPGVRQPSPNEDPNLLRLNIESAILTDAHKLRVTYSHNMQKGGSLALAIRMPGERHPRVRVSLAGKSGVNEVVTLPENALADASGALLANLLADVAGESIEGPLTWVIQEDRLTHEPGDGAGPVKKPVQETGEGLHELLDEIGNRDGIPGVIDFLQHFNIRFFDGDGRGGLSRRFHIAIRDPFQPDLAPEWLKHLPDKAADLEAAIMEFVERHEKRRLRRHATRGNINGMENFLDVFTALVRILYVYAERGVVKRGKLQSRLCRFVELATRGGSTRDGEPFDGYLKTTSTNLGGVSLLQDRCHETNYLAIVSTALLIARKIRAAAESLPAKEFLPTTTQALEDGMHESGLQPPTTDKVREALTSYRMLADEDIRDLLTQLE